MEGKTIQINSDDILFGDDDDDDTGNTRIDPDAFKSDSLTKDGKDESDYNPAYVLKKMYFISQRKEDIYEHFKIDPEPVGMGSFGTVYKGVDKATGEVRAIKQIGVAHFKDKSRYNNFINEVTALKTLDHPNIIKLYEVYECESAVYLVQEFCDGGELFDYVANKQSLTEQEAAVMFRQMCGAIIYCHKNRICHRDLKPENFMLNKLGDEWTVKLIDFGISRSYFQMDMDPTQQLLRMQSIAGTTPYMAPEIFRRNYSNSCDTWSLGVILFIMLAGYPPFEGFSENEIAEKIVKVEYDYNDPIWKNVSDEAKQLISKMITTEKERITPKEALNDPWMANVITVKKMKTNKVLMNRLVQFQNTCRLRKTILSFLASKASDEDMKEEIEFFNSIDVNKDGYITLKELKKGLTKYTNGNKDIITNIMKHVDTENNGAISFNEFLAASLNESISKDYDKISKAFRFFDKDNNGEINDKELKATLAGSEFKHIETKIFTDVLNECGIKKDGVINLNEFMRLMSIKVEDSFTSSLQMSTLDNYP